jgi:signal transduction histidine kinase
MRLTLLYGGLFLLSGAAVLAVTYLLVQHATADTPITLSDGTTVISQGDGKFRVAKGAPAPSPAPSPGDFVPPENLTDEQAETQAQRLIATATEQRAAQLHQLLTQSGIALGAMSVASIGLGWIVAGRVLRPLRTITNAAREISATNLHQRLALQRPDDELKELGDTFDELLGRLEASFQSQRRFVANASHELRTPLARQRTLVQVALSDPHATIDSLQTAHERVLDATYQQERLIDALLTLARGERGLDRRQPLNLAEIAGHVLLTRDTEATRRGIHLARTLHHAPAFGDPQLVERLVANLVDNALRYNTAAGRLEVSTKTTTDGSVLSVTNTGPVIPADQIDRLFQPFQRLGTDRTHHDSGLGLGLSIVHAVATAHDATVQAHPRPTGGLQMTVSFPGVGIGPHPPARHRTPGSRTDGTVPGAVFRPGTPG